MPPLKQRFSCVTSGDISCGAHNLGGGVACGGELRVPVNNQLPHPAPIQQAPSWVNAFGPDTSTSSFHFSGNGPNDFADLGFDFSQWQSFVNALSVGDIGGTDQSGYSIHVIDQGGAYSSSGENPTVYNQFDFLDQGTQAYDRGKTLVVFKGAGTVQLTCTPGSTQEPFGSTSPGAQGNFVGTQFGPSVLAPFAHVIVDDNAGFVDGFIICASLNADSPNLQLHGDNFVGVNTCPE